MNRPAGVKQADEFWAGRRVFNRPRALGWDEFWVTAAVKLRARVPRSVGRDATLLIWPGILLF